MEEKLPLPTASPAAVDREPPNAQAVLDALPLATLTISLDGRIQYANRAAAELFGASTGTLPGERLVDLLPEEVRAQVQVLIESGEKETLPPVELYLKSGDGSGHVLRLSVLENRTANDKQPIVIIEDISDLHRLQDHLRQSRKLEAIGLLASGFAHNINSPLSAIIMTAEMAQVKHPDVREFEDILQAAARIGEIVTNLMIKSRQEQASAEAEIDLNQLVRTELKFLEANLFFKHSVELDLDLQEDLPKVRGLYGDFSQIFQNLVQNALDAMADSEENHLQVRTWYERDGERVGLSIRDNGCGIPEDHVDKLFQPFFTTKTQLDGSDPIQPSGTGLGLHMTWKLVEQYGGTIQVESRPGEGSLFTLLIPMRKSR
jgi:PAS domain S-box-containing protein